MPEGRMAALRASMAIYILMNNDEVTTAVLTEKLGYTGRQSVHKLMRKFQNAGIPIYQPSQGLWAIHKDQLKEVPLDEI